MFLKAERHTLPFSRCLPFRTGSKQGQGLPLAAAFRGAREPAPAAALTL